MELMGLITRAVPLTSLRGIFRIFGVPMHGKVAIPLVRVKMVATLYFSK